MEDRLYRDLRILIPVRTVLGQTKCTAHKKAAKRMLQRTFSNAHEQKRDAPNSAQHSKLEKRPGMPPRTTPEFIQCTTAGNDDAVEFSNQARCRHDMNKFHAIKATPSHQRT